MSKFYEEVFEQPQVIRNTIHFNKESSFTNAGKPYLFTGMGSSLAASELLTAYFNQHGISSIAIDNSELLHYYTAMLEQHYVVVVSQSGESFEAKEIVKRYPHAVSVTNTKGSTVADHVYHVFYTYAQKEEAIASSKSFTTTVALLLLLGSKAAGLTMEDDLYKAADVLEKELEKADEYKKQIGEALDPNRPLLLLGRGPSVFTARQGALTLKETARMYTEAMSASQFRHGPFELIKENLQVLFFNPKGKTYEINQRYVLEMAELGAKMLYVSDEKLNHKNICSLAIPSVNEYVSTIPYSLVTQLAAVELSAQKGLVAGQAELISKVTGRE
ncbi:SIS domain-containing protein [Aneurinibacillus tyrosinisolvens]|uniref:SIS domain-containing protein n=1 Tax=Aneurinibacillus tyrosinisolvens TaxID=1443435 RepID=UPI00063F6E14|nr:SIS domain-containing protein [Aneurinibacillus tyrosinisolvens]